MLLPSPCPVLVLRRRSFHCFPKMASKLVNRILTVCKAGLRFVPSRNSPLKTTMLTASQSILHSRSYSDHPNKKSGSLVSSTSSLNEAELNKFSAIAETWWDAEGPFKPLHVMNPTRLAFILSTLCRHFSKDPNSPRPFEGLKIVDVGCGGGILSEPLARLGATVTGVDALDKNIKIARLMR